MDLKNVFLKRGFLELLAKCFLFVGLIAVVQVLIQPLSDATPLPDEFKPFSLIFIEDMIVFVISVFIVYNWKELFCVRRCPLKGWEVVVFVLLGTACVGTYYELKFSIAASGFFFEHVSVFVLLKYMILSMMVACFAFAAFGTDMIFGMYERYRGQVPYLVLIGAGYWSLATLLESIWSELSGVVAHMVYSLLLLTEENVALNMSPHGPVLSASGFGAVIGALCSGIESLLLFAALYAVFLAVDKVKLDFSRALVMFFPALLGVFLLNVARIYLLYLAGIYVSREFALGMFHTNMGWILFAGYFFVFLYYAYPWMMTGKK